MTVRTCILFVLLFAFSQRVCAQEKNWQHQIGFDGTTFVRNFINFSGTNGTFTTSLYPLQFKALKRKKYGEEYGYKGFRMGMGSRITNSEQTTSTTITKTHTLAADLRVGLEFQRVLAGRFMVFYGPDLLVGHTKTTNENTTGSPFPITTKVSNESTVVGGGIAGGIQFNINKRFAMGTEMSYYVKSSVTKSRTTGISGNGISLNNFTLDLMLPNVLYFNVLF